MKANEAPENIYLYPSDRACEEYEAEWGAIPWGEDYVEYTRTDVLIEKAVSYLNSKLYDWVRIKHPNPSVSPNVIIKQDFIEDFKNYMKGE